MTKRNNGIDFLKIILALMVLTLHYNASLGQVAKHTVALSFNWFFVWFMESVSFCAVNIYVLISGYYLYLYKNNLASSLNKIKSLWFIVVFYSLVEYFAVRLYFDGIKFTDFLLRLLPLTTGQWWFFSLYVLMLLVSPFINKAIVFSNDKEIRWTLIAGIISLCILPQLVLWKDGFGVDHGYSFIWFVFLYFTGAVIAKTQYDIPQGIIKEYFDFLNLNNKTIIFLLFFSLFGSKVLIALVSNALWGQVKYSGVFFSYNSIIVYLLAIALFLYFKNISFSGEVISKFIAAISPLSLASYLFHCQLDFREFVWPAMKCYKYANDSILPVAYLVTIFLLFIAAILLEKFRIFLFDGIARLYSIFRTVKR